MGLLGLCIACSSRPARRNWRYASRGKVCDIFGFARFAADWTVWRSTEKRKLEAGQWSVLITPFCIVLLARIKQCDMKLFHHLFSSVSTKRTATDVYL